MALSKKRHHIYTAAIVYKTFVFVSSCCFFCILTLTAAAQTRGNIEVIKDSRIDTLIARRYSSKKGSSNRYSSSGYRVQFFSGPSRAAAFKAQAHFQELYPDIRTYISYKEPNFKVKAGDFRSRIEAAKLVQQLRSQYNTLFILGERINAPLQPVSND